MTTKKKILLAILFAVIIGILFTPVTYNQLKVGDYPHNIRQAQELSTNGYMYLKANMLFHRMLLVVRDVLPFNFLARISPFLKQVIDLKSYEISSYIVIIGITICIGFTLFSYLNKKINLPEKKGKYFILGGLSLLIMLVGPITIFTLPERQYMGYWNGNPVHNPPFTVMKVFAVLFFVIVTEIAYKPYTWKKLLSALACIALATLAKPNFALSILPAFLIVYGLIRFREIKNRNLVLLTVSISLVAIIILATQYFIMYTGDRGESLLFSPFKVMLLTSPNIPSVLFYSLMSIAFPLEVTISWWRKLKNDAAIQLAWVNFLISLAYAYLLSEQTDMASANFWWNPMVAVFLLFMVTVPVFVNELVLCGSIKRTFTWKNTISGIFLLLHVICGIYFLYSSILSTTLVK